MSRIKRRHLLTVPWVAALSAAAGAAFVALLLLLVEGLHFRASADVPITVAVVSTVSPVVAGALPLIVGWVRDTRSEKREQLAAERLRIEQERRRECVKLLRMARDFRVLVENAHDSLGSDLVAHAQLIRQSAANIAGQADEVGFIVPGAETTANSLAAEASLLAATIVDKENRTPGASLYSPEFTRFDRFLEEFKETARATLDETSVINASNAEKAGTITEGVTR